LKSAPAIATLHQIKAPACPQGHDGAAGLAVSSQLPSRTVCAGVKLPFVDIDEQSAAWLTQTADKRWRHFVDYWTKLAGAKGGLPSRQDIDPIDIPRDALPFVLLVDVVRAGQGLRFRFRMVGTGIVAVEGEETGHYLEDIVDQTRLAQIRPHYVDCVSRKVWVRHHSLHSPAGDRVDSDALLLPLSADGTDVDMLFGLTTYPSVIPADE